MTYVGIFKEAAELQKLKQKNRLLTKSNKQLQSEVNQLKKDLTIIKEGNSALELYRDENISGKLKKLIEDMTASLKLAPPLIRKYPRTVLFASSIKGMIKFTARVDEIYKSIKNRLN